MSFVPEGRYAMRVSGITAPVLWATLFAMTLFAGNSLLNRMALLEEGMPPLSYACLRMSSGAIALWLIARARRDPAPHGGSWLSALALAAYMVFFSLAYQKLPAAVGTLIIAAAVPGIMVAWGLAHGEAFTLRLGAGLLLALAGLFFLLMPGLSAPSPSGAALMFLSGASWGMYSILGKNSAHPLRDTAGNFLRGVPVVFAVQLCIFAADAPASGEFPASLTPTGVMLALAAGGLASALGYAVWYAVMPRYTYAGAAAVQLSVPLITAAAALPLLGEAVTPRIAVSSGLILAGIALVILVRKN